MAPCAWGAVTSDSLATALTARVTVRVRAQDGGPVEGAAVKSGSARAASDASGTALLVLNAGPHLITVVRLGYAPDTLHVRLTAATDTTMTAVMRETAIEVAPVVVSSTRTERRLEDEPERVEVLAGEDVEEKSQTRPGDVTTLVKEIPGVRLQVSAPATGAAGLRIQGLRAQYSAVLIDGLPLHGGEGLGLGLLQIPPLDVQQAEVIKGAATALYGPSALGGVLDIVTRRPGDVPERTVLLNQTTRAGTDGALWLSKKFGERWGATFLGGVHGQNLTDVNHDGWADLAGYTRGELRPRLFWSGESGRSLELTAGATFEDREGGGDGDLRRHADTDHGDAGFHGRLPLGRSALVEMRGAWSAEWQDHRVFDPVQRAVVYHDRVQTGLGEAVYRRTSGAAVWLLGAAWNLAEYRNADLPGFDYRYSVPAALGQVTWTMTPWLSSSAAARLDAHNQYGTHVSPRVSALAHAGHDFDARLSWGEGFHAPTPFMEETQPLPLTRLRPPSGLEAERAHSLSLDLTARHGPLEVNATGFVSRIENPVALLEPADTVSDPAATRAGLSQAEGPTNTGGVEIYAFYLKEPITVTANYSWLSATEIAPGEIDRRDVPLTPRHGAGLDVAWESDESGTRAGIEVFYTGKQSLENDPYRSVSAPFATVGLLVSQRLGTSQVFVNAENLGDVRQSHYEPILLPQPTPDGRLSVDSWAPAEGRVVNAGVKLAF